MVTLTICMYCGIWWYFGCTVVCSNIVVFNPIVVFSGDVIYHFWVYCGEKGFWEMYVYAWLFSSFAPLLFFPEFKNSVLFCLFMLLSERKGRWIEETG